MNKFVIVSDSCCDLNEELRKKYDIDYIPMGIAYNAVILPPDFIGRKDTKRRRWLCALPSPSLN